MTVYLFFVLINIYLGYYFIYDEASRFEKIQSIFIIVFLSFFSLLTTIAYIGYYVIKKLKPFGY